MRYKKTIVALLLFLIFGSLWFLSLDRQKDIIIKEAKMVTGVDQKMMPLKITNTFPKDTSKVSAWISWKNAKINTQVLFKWHYVTDDVPIYDYNLNIPRRDGVANVVLSMPEGKNLPSGTYKADIFSGRRLIKTLSFEIE
jgi:hypothetical protein